MTSLGFLPEDLLTLDSRISWKQSGQLRSSQIKNHAICGLLFNLPHGGVCGREFPHEDQGKALQIW